MRTICLLLTALLLAAAIVTEAQPDRSYERDAAFYEGEKLTYIVFPPDQFRMIDHEAATDGYSCAFVPDSQQYQTAETIIGINMFKTRGLKFADVVARDTAALREHYGSNVAIRPVDSVTAASGQTITTFSINDTARFIPNIMIAYVDGQTELLVFELVITDHAASSTAESTFIQCLKRLKVQPIGELGQK